MKYAIVVLVALMLLLMMPSPAKAASPLSEQWPWKLYPTWFYEYIARDYMWGGFQNLPDPDYVKANHKLFPPFTETDLYGSGELEYNQLPMSEASASSQFEMVVLTFIPNPTEVIR
jgi:hypothetical protein